MIIIQRIKQLSGYKSKAYQKTAFGHWLGKNIGMIENQFSWCGNYRWGWTKFMLSYKNLHAVLHLHTCIHTIYK